MSSNKSKVELDEIPASLDSASAALGWTGAVCAAATFLVVAICSPMVRASMPADWQSVLRPSAVFGHSLTASIAVSLAFFGRALWSRRRELKALRAGTRNETSTWQVIIDHCRNSDLRYSDSELVLVFDEVRRFWNQEFASRTIALLYLSAVPALCGLVEGTHSLRVDQGRAVLESYQTIYRPLLVGTAESLVLGVVVFGLRLAWENLTLQWQQWAVRPLNARFHTNDVANADTVRGAADSRPAASVGEDASDLSRTRDTPKVVSAGEEQREDVVSQSISANRELGLVLSSSSGPLPIGHLSD